MVNVKGSEWLAGPERIPVVSSAPHRWVNNTRMRSPHSGPKNHLPKLVGSTLQGENPAVSKGVASETTTAVYIYIIHYIGVSRYLPSPANDPLIGTRPIGLNRGWTWSGS